MSTIRRVSFTDGFSSEIVPAESIVSANEFLVGNVVPTTEGNDGDLYLDASTGIIYLKSSGTWSVNQTISLPASNIVNTPAGNISATDIQAAINELDSEKLNKTGGTITGSLQIDTDLTVTGDLTVNGTTTTIDTDNLNVSDANIVINDNGNDATSEGAGLTVERTGTDGSLIYADAATSKFKVGAVGSEVEIADISSAQTQTNKTIVVASNTITTAAAGNLTSTELNAALNELQLDIDGVSAGSLSGLTDTNISGIATDDTLSWDGTDWINKPVKIINPNILINGDGRVNQRNTLPKTTVVDGKYYLDRWKTSINVIEGDASLVTTSQPSALSGSKSLKYICTDIDATDPEVGVLGAYQIIEDYSILAGKIVTFSVWVKSNHTEARFRVWDGVTNHISTAHTGGGAWEKLSLTFTINSSVTFLSCQVVIFSSAATNVSISVNDYIEFTGAKLELGSEATEFVADSYGDSLRKCQRYYEKGSVRWDGYAVSPTNYSAAVYYKVEKYTITTPTITNSSVTNFNATTNVVGNTLEGFSAWHSSTSTGTAAFADIWIVEAEL